MDQSNDIAKSAGKLETPSDTERKGLSKPEPAPRQNESQPIWEMVVEDMQERDRSGRAKYGTPLQAHNGRDALVDAYQEVLDLAVYLRQAIEERKMPSREFINQRAEGLVMRFMLYSTLPGWPDGLQLKEIMAEWLEDAFLRHNRSLPTTPPPIPKPIACVNCSHSLSNIGRCMNPQCQAFDR